MYYFHVSESVLLVIDEGNKGELVDLNGNNCSSIQGFPRKADRSVGAYVDGTPIVCGGDLGDSEERKKCYKYTNGWNFLAKMTIGRMEAAAVTVSGGRIWITGGKDKTPLETIYLKSTEYIDAKGNVEKSLDLPDKRLVSIVALQWQILDRKVRFLINARVKKYKKDLFLLDFFYKLNIPALFSNLFRREKRAGNFELLKPRPNEFGSITARKDDTSTDQSFAIKGHKRR